MALTNKPDNRILDRLSGTALSTLALAACCSTAFAGRARTAAPPPVQESRPSVAASGNPRDAELESIAWRADLSGNGVVDFADIQLFLAALDSSNAGTLTDPGQADINMDGVVNFTDLNLILAFWGMAVQAPQAGATLQPGSGFSGPTAQPAAVGVPGSPGYDAKAIARWDVVPYQEFDGEFHVGVVAFHRKGISRVEFSLNGGPWSPVHEMTLNPRTEVWEYWATINANELSDGPVEVRAVAYPNVGEPRVLEPLYLNANAHGTWGRGEVWVSSLFGNDQTGTGTENAPFKTIWKAMQSFGSGANIDGLTVNLKAGEYVFTGLTNPYPVTADGWVTISAAPGTSSSDVRVVGVPGGTENRLRIGRIHLKGLTLDQRNGWGMLTFNTVSPMLWLDDVVALGPGPQTNNTKPFHYPHWTSAFVTGASIRDYKDGCLGAQIARDVSIENIGSDAYTNSMLVVNCSVDGITGYAELDFHPDVYQFHGAWGHRENVIVYGLRAYNVWAQGIFANDLDSMKDIAFVNVLIERVVTPNAGPADPLYSQWQVEPTDHLLLWHVTLVNQEFRWREPNVRNVSVVGCAFHACRGIVNLFPINLDQWAAMGDWRSNHFVLGSGHAVVTPGLDVTSGDPGFANASLDDFRPGPNSPLRARLGAICRPAADGVQRQEVTSVGAFER